MRTLHWSATAALLLAAPVAASAQGAQGARAAADSAGARAVGSPSAAAPTDAPRPGDVVRLRVWREPDMSGEFRVDEHGDAVLPRLGPVRVTAMSADSLRRRLMATYAAYLRDPSIEVTLLRRVSVAGAVRTPGVFTVEPTMTVADVVALAGGTAPEGRKDRVEVLRDGVTVSRSVSRGARIGDTVVRSGDQLIVPERGWLSRNTGVVTAAIGALGFLIPALLSR